MNEITIYTRPTCPFCNKLKGILDSRKIKYKDYDVTKNEPPRHVVDQDGHIPVPQVEYNGRIIYDYKDEETLANEIGKIMKEY
ncbi:MAG: glutaredoxin [Candidatus Micrarchaeota archaeon]|nr:glutaredoxin [Candidatus Micrarchaeota archaeon]